MVEVENLNRMLKSLTIIPYVMHNIGGKMMYLILSYVIKRELLISVRDASKKSTTTIHQPNRQLFSASSQAGVLHAAHFL